MNRCGRDSSSGIYGSERDRLYVENAYRYFAINLNREEGARLAQLFDLGEKGRNKEIKRLESALLASFCSENKQFADLLPWTSYKGKHFREYLGGSNICSTQELLRRYISSGVEMHMPLPTYVETLNQRINAEPNQQVRDEIFSHVRLLRRGHIHGSKLFHKINKRMGQFASLSPDERCNRWKNLNMDRSAMVLSLPTAASSPKMAVLTMTNKYREFAQVYLSKNVTSEEAGRLIPIGNSRHCSDLVKLVNELLDGFTHSHPEYQDKATTDQLKNLIRKSRVYSIKSLLIARSQGLLVTDLDCLADAATREMDRMQLQQHQGRCSNTRADLDDAAGKDGASAEWQEIEPETDSETLASSWLSPPIRGLRRRSKRKLEGSAVTYVAIKVFSEESKNSVLRRLSHYGITACDVLWHPGHGLEKWMIVVTFIDGEGPPTIDELTSEIDISNWSSNFPLEKHVSFHVFTHCSLHDFIVAKSRNV
jgi:hypothetical protein